jgi:hypothetical protein
VTEPACPAFFGHDPGPLDPWRRVADVLFMSALEFSNPVIFSVGMEANNFSLHAGHSTSEVRLAAEPGARSENVGITVTFFPLILVPAVPPCAPAKRAARSFERPHPGNDEADDASRN